MSTDPLCHRNSIDLGSPLDATHSPLAPSLEYSLVTHSPVAPIIKCTVPIESESQGNSDNSNLLRDRRPSQPVLVNISGHRRGPPEHVEIQSISTFCLSSLRPPIITDVKSTAYGQPARTPRLGNTWEFAGWGKTIVTELHQDTLNRHGKVQKKAQIGQFRSTAIAGTAVTGGVLYTVGTAIAVSGQYAPISLLLVCGVVFIFRFIFAELSSIPFDGGVYSLMLVGSTKLVAAIAACCSILDLAATAVVSAGTASNYFYGHWGLINTYGATIGILAAFAILALFGVKDSANLSLAIFVVHILTMCALVGASIVFWIRNGPDILVANWNLPSPSGNVAKDIFSGFCVGMLGFTGFETVSNYIEETKPGVYNKTMRNMSYLVLAFMPLLTLCTLVVLPRNIIEHHVDHVLSVLGQAIAGETLRIIVSVDACIVLCGGVLCGFVGVVGLLEHMAHDHLLPELLLKTNQWTKSHHYIIFTYLLLCCLLVVITNNNITSLSLLFALAFLSVLFMFAWANILLKYKRGRLARAVTASWTTVLAGLLAVIAAIIGNGILSPAMIGTFAAFFTVMFGAMAALLYQVPILRFLLFVADKHAKLYTLADKLMHWLKNARSHPVAFFTNHDEIHVLNKAVLYVAHNEPTMHLLIVHFFEEENKIPPSLESNCHILDHVYPKITIDLILVKSKFSPSAVACMAKLLGISRNQCYITCPGEKVDEIGKFGGARVIML